MACMLIVGALVLYWSATSLPPLGNFTVTMGEEPKIVSSCISRVTVMFLLFENILPVLPRETFACGANIIVDWLGIGNGSTY